MVTFQDKKEPSASSGTAYSYTKPRARTLFLITFWSAQCYCIAHINRATHNDIGSPFPNDPMDLLDAFVSEEEKGEVFVLLAMEPNFAYIASNNTLPLTISTYLHKIWSQLKDLNAVLEFPTDSESSPNPTKGCHNKIYLWWFCPFGPFLLSQEQRRVKELTLDTQVRKWDECNPEH